jgi:hypothetical protein
MGRSSKYLDGLYELSPMPLVVPEVLAHYQSTLKARMDALPINEEEAIRVPSDAVPPNEFRHLLLYDAESVFWYLL